MNKETKLPDGVTVEMVAGWKERYGENKVKLAKLTNEAGETTLAVIVRVPDRKTLGEFEKWIDRNPMKSKEIMVNACLLTEKERVKADDELFYAAFDAITELLPLRKAIVENL